MSGSLLQPPGSTVMRKYPTISSKIGFRRFPGIAPGIAEKYLFGETAPVHPGFQIAPKYSFNTFSIGLRPRSGRKPIENLFCGYFLANCETWGGQAQFPGVSPKRYFPAIPWAIRGNLRKPILELTVGYFRITVDLGGSSRLPDITRRTPSLRY